MISWKRWLLAALGVLLLAAGMAGIFLLQPGQKEEHIAVTLEGERDLTIPVGGVFTDSGASAFYHTEDADPVSLEVTVTGTVDTSVVGQYMLSYTARWEDCLGTAYRRVRVVDEIPPQIMLTEDPEGYTLPGHTYVEEGFSALDNYDGDLTHRVVRRDHGEQISYTVKDSSGNRTTVIRAVRFNDPIAPVLKLKGNAHMTMTVGSSFREPGWEASDNCDGDLASKVEVTGSVNIYSPGTYVLVYRVKDTFGNMARAERKVTVQARVGQSSTGSAVPLPDVVAPNGDKVIYLTFDDGPSKYTPKLLDVLKKYNVKATFFVVNTPYISTVKRIAEEGHTVAIHSASHVYSNIYSSENAYFTDLYKMQNIIRNYTGQTATILRFPGGTANSVSKKYNKGIMTRLSQQVTEKGFRYFDWNVTSGDTGNAKTANSVFNNVIKGVQKHKYSVVLQHDIKSYSVDAVESIINWGLSHGYTFLPLTMDSPVCAHKPTN